MEKQSVSTPIIKPVDALCNLSCSYCCVFGIRKCAKKRRMQSRILKSVIDFFCSNQDDTEFIWHGGEPLLAGLDFFRDVVKFQYPWLGKNKRIANFIQTNATLVDYEWARFFAENKFFVGVSLDGPRKFHDQLRCYPNGKGSYEDVMRGINLLREAGIFNGVICDISSINHLYPKEIFDFFIAEGIKKLKFSRVRDIGHCNDVSELFISSGQYTDFMINIFDLWLGLDDPEVEIRDIQSVVGLLLGGTMRECIYTGRCDQFVTVYSDGSIYGCDSFPKSDALCFGNVLDGQFSIRSSARLEGFQDLLRKRKEHCQICKWFSICRGGCAKDCYTQLNSIEPLSEACENLKRYFEHISSKLRLHGLIK